MLKETLQVYLDTLGSQTGGKFVLEENGCARIRFDESLDIVVEGHENLGLLLLHAPVHSLSNCPDRSALFQNALETALFGVGTGGCVLGYDRDSDQLVLSVSRPVQNLDSQGFVNLFGQFTEIATRLRGTFSQNPAEASGNGDVDEDPDKLSGAEYLRV